MTSLPQERLLEIIDTQNQVVATALNLDAVMELVVARARALVDASAAVLELLDGEEMVYQVASGASEKFVGLRLRADSSLSGRCVALDEVLYCEDSSVDGRVDYDACRLVGAVSMVCVPLKHADQVVGVLKVYDPHPRAFDDADLRTLEMLSSVIASHMAHAGDFQEQRHASRHDALTGLLNRRGFDERLGAEAARARRYGDLIALCIFDLDAFKAVNDLLGHSAGDEVLRNVGRHLEELRGEDETFRLGGDEFAILLVGSTREGARLVGERVALAVRDDPESCGVTLSVGVAALEDDDPLEMVRRADEDLYLDKRDKLR